MDDDRTIPTCMDDPTFKRGHDFGYSRGQHWTFQRQIRATVLAYAVLLTVGVVLGWLARSAASALDAHDPTLGLAVALVGLLALLALSRRGSGVRDV